MSHPNPTQVSSCPCRFSNWSNFWGRISQFFLGGQALCGGYTYLSISARGPMTIAGCVLRGDIANRGSWFPVQLDTNWHKFRQFQHRMFCDPPTPGRGKPSMEIEIDSKMCIEWDETYHRQPSVCICRWRGRGWNSTGGIGVAVSTRPFAAFPPLEQCTRER